MKITIEIPDELLLSAPPHIKGKMCSRPFVTCEMERGGVQADPTQKGESRASLPDGVEVVPKGEKLTYSIKEASQLTGVNRDTLYMLARTKQLPGLIRFGKRILVARVALNKALAEGWTPQDPERK